MNELKQKRYKNYIKKNVVLIPNGYRDTFLSCFQLNKHEEKVKRELFASSSKSLFYVIALRGYSKPSNEAVTWVGKNSLGKMSRIIDNSAHHIHTPRELWS